MKSKSLAVLLLIFVCPVQAAVDNAKFSAEYAKGLTAYQNKDYATALMLWFPLAEKDDAQAQFMLGNMYLQQEGDRNNTIKALQWYERAAKQNHLAAIVTHSRQMCSVPTPISRIRRSTFRK